MVDKKKLNRIKGILSARQGAEIPKFTPGGPMMWNGQGDKEIKFHKKNGYASIYSNDGVTWFQDLGLIIPYTGSLDGYVDATEDTGVKPPMEIPGQDSAQGDPNAAVSAAADANAAANAHQAAQTAAVTAQRRMEALPSLSSLSTENKITYNGPTSEEIFRQQARKEMNERASEGMRLRQEALRQEELKKENAVNGAGQIVTGALEAVGGALGAAQASTDSNTTKTVDTIYDTAAGVVENLGPVGKVVGTAMKFAGMAGDAIQAMGGGTDQQTKMDQWMDSSFFSWNIGMLNGFAGKNSDSFGADLDTLAAVGSSYGGTASDINDAASKAGKKYGLFSSKARKKANEAIATVKSQQNLMGSIADNATDQRLAVQSMGEQAGLAYSLMTDGGYSQKYTYAAKQGGMLEWNPVETLEWEPRIELNWELPVFKEGGNIDIVEELEWIPEFKTGGKTEESDIPKTEETSQKNVIPEGALHKNKHHMEHAEGLTKKGIPVIDDDGEQQAEIEHSEIIFTLEVTKKLEEYYEIFYSDESSNKEKEQAAIDAGKLLVFQILENTEDRTGLIESCKKGGSLTLKTTTDDLIEEVLEWMPTVFIVEEKEPEEKHKKKEEKSEKEQMKEAIKEVLIELLTK